MKRDLFELLNKFFWLIGFILLMVGITDIFLWKQKVIHLDMSFLGLVFGLSILFEKNFYHRLNIGIILLLSALCIYVPNKLLELMQISVLSISINDYILIMIVVSVVLVTLWVMKHWSKTKNRNT
ncbi:hypothetical protein BH747_11675 [Enterococcus villorum]|uniref:Uncharacterized protein n=1 Tax=Enterococcus villorum TaxID=112904 RepID=A0A1V8Y7A9_9ENTE|nr:hypothetical protein BH747_11675 [Enterococcus villorum]OQO74420.1 hypothetical protein BH744_07145 [Enterococcus villorum]